MMTPHNPKLLYSLEFYTGYKVRVGGMHNGEAVTALRTREYGRVSIQTAENVYNYPLLVKPFVTLDKHMRKLGWTM